MFHVRVRVILMMTFGLLYSCLLVSPCTCIYGGFGLLVIQVASLTVPLYQGYSIKIHDHVYFIQEHVTGFLSEEANGFLSTNNVRLLGAWSVRQTEYLVSAVISKIRPLWLGL